MSNKVLYTGSTSTEISDLVTTARISDDTSVMYHKYMAELEMAKMAAYRYGQEKALPRTESLAREIQKDYPYLARFLDKKSIPDEDKPILIAELVKIKLLGLDEMPEAVWIAYHTAKGFLDG